MFASMKRIGLSVCTPVSSVVLRLHSANLDCESITRAFIRVKNGKNEVEEAVCTWFLS